MPFLPWDLYPIPQQWLTPYHLGRTHPCTSLDIGPCSPVAPGCLRSAKSSWLPHWWPSGSDAIFGLHLSFKTQNLVPSNSRLSKVLPGFLVVEVVRERIATEKRKNRLVLLSPGGS